MSNKEEEEEELWSEHEYEAMDAEESAMGKDAAEDDDPVDDIFDTNLSEEEWLRIPKTWTTLAALAAFRNGTLRLPTDEELFKAALGLIREDGFSASWSCEHEEIIFWPASIPLDEISDEVL